MGEVRIRAARDSDAQAIGLLHAQNFRENNLARDFADAFLEQLPASLHELWQGRIERPRDNQLILAAFNEVSLLGFVCAYGADDSRWGSLIDNLHVVHAARKTGVGSSLMDHASAWLTARYSDMAVFLLVLESNSAARRFYERLGARNAATLAMETHGGAVVRNCRYTWPSPQQMSAD